MRFALEQPRFWWRSGLFLVFLISIVSASDVVMVGEHEANGLRLLAKLNPSSAAAGKSSKGALSSDAVARIAEASPAVNEIRAMSEILGLVVLEMSPLPAAPAQRSATKVPVDRTVEIKQRIEALMATGLYEYVEPDYMVHLDNVPTDSAFSNGTLWGLRNTSRSAADIDAEAAWAVTTGSTNVVVAVIDTGIRYTHRDLAANMWRNPGEIPGDGIDNDRNGYVDDVHGINAITGSGNPLDDQGHGSHCAGTIGAQANGGGPHVGVAWDVRLMALKFLDRNGSGFLSDAIECINYAVANGAQILSNSWGGGPYSQALYDAILRSRNAGSLFVAAAGNDSDNNDSFPAYPASYNIDNVISVAAMDSFDNLASFSNFGVGSVHVGAPGVDIYSCTSSSDVSYASFNGTSMACPHVAGVAALALARFPGTTGTALRTRLLSNVRSIPSLSGRVSTSGAISASRVVVETPPPSPSLTASLSTRPSTLQAGSPGSMSITLSSAGDLVPGATSVTGVVSGRTLVFLDNGITPDDSANDGIYTTSVDAFPTAGFYTLSLNASHPTRGPLSTSLAFEVIASSVSNDNWSQSAPVSGVRLSASSVTATAEPNEPGWRDGAPALKTLWWRWRPGSSGSFTITTFDSSFDTTLSVFTGSSLEGLTRVTSNDDSGGTVQSSVTFAVRAGSDYYIQVDGYGGATGNVVLNVPNSGGTPPATPPVFSRNPVDATVRPGSAATFTAEASGNPAYQWTKNGVDLSDSSRLSGANGPSLIISTIEADDTGAYVCRATNDSGSTESSAAFLVVQVGTPPKNDDFDSRLRLQTGVEVTASNEFATRETNEPNHAARDGGGSIWYNWVSSVNGTVSVSTSGSSFDTALAVYEGSAVGALREVGSNDNNGTSPQSLVQFTAKLGQEYQIAVDGGRPRASGFVRLALRAAGSGGGGGDAVVPAPGMPIPVPDLGQIVSEIIVSGRTLPVSLSSILLDLNLAHSFRGDLEVTLEAPSGEVIIVSNRQGGSASDLVISSVPLNSPQFGGLNPSIDPNGTWRLRVFDRAGGDDGTLNGWALRFRDGGGGGGGGDPEVVVPGLPVPIPDSRDVVTSSLTVSGQPSTRTANQIRLDLLIRHTFVGDLTLTLQTPGGETINIRRREGGPAQEVRVQSQPLDTFTWNVPIPSNIDPNGTWILSISDEAAGDSGNLEAWALRFGSPSIGRPDLTNLPAGRFFGRFGELDPSDGGPSARAEVILGNGSITLNLTRRGKVTGHVIYRGARQPLRGRLDASGFGSAVSIARDGRRLDFSFALTQTEQGQWRLDGTASFLDSSGQPREVPVQLLPPLPFDLSPQPLRLNILLRNVGPDKAPVTGDGFARARTGRGGALRYSGAAPDGVKFTGTGQTIEVTPGSYEVIIAARLGRGNMLLGQPLANLAPAIGQAHLQGSVLWLRRDGVVNCLTQGVVWEVSPGQSLVDNRPFVLMGLNPPWKSYFTTPVIWTDNNKAFLDYDTMRRINVEGKTGLFRGNLPLPPQSGSLLPGRYRGILFGRPILDDGAWLYGGGHLLESAGVSSYVEIFLPDASGGGLRTSDKIRER